MSMLLFATLRGLMLRSVWMANSAALEADVFTNNDVRVLVQYLGELHETLNRNLTPLDLHLAIESKYRKPGGRQEELLGIVTQLEGMEEPTFEEVQPHIADFLSRELAAKAALYVASHDDSDKFDISVPYELLTRAVELAGGMSLDVENMIDAPAPGDVEDRLGLATVGLGPSMDVHLGGGVADGEMLIILAPPGVGKTSVLKKMGVEQAKTGEHVLDITLEISGNKVRQRYDQALTGLTSEERLGRPKTVVAARRAVKGSYHVKDWCDRNVTVDDVRNLVNSMRANGNEVTAVSIDYLELMSPTRNSRHAERFNYSMVAKEVRRLANELHVKLYTAWQINRLGSTKHVIGKEDVSECWDVIKHADIILGLNQNEQELENKILRISIMKQRESTARPIEYYYSDLDRMVIKEQGIGDDDGPPEEMGVGDRSGVRKHWSGTTVSGQA